MRGILTLILITVLFFSCNKSENCEDSKKDCSNVRCIGYFSYFDFILVDKTTGKDLVFGTNPRYSASEIKLYFDASKAYPIPVYRDSVNKIFVNMFAKDEMYLEVKGVDTYKLTTDFRSGRSSSRYDCP